MGRPRRSIPVQVTANQTKLDKYRQLVQAAYYSAASDSPSMDFSFASGVGFNEALSADLNILRNRVRYELRQNGPAKGLTRTYANSTISTGPTLSLETADRKSHKTWAEETEFQFSEWCRNCGYVRGESLAELLHIGVRQFFSAGEYFAINKIDRAASTNIKLRCLMIRPDRVASPYIFSGKIIDGIEFDDNGKPLFYHIENDSNQYIKEAAKNVRHVFYMESPEQVRGEPWLASGLPDLHKRRRYDEARVAAAIVAAKFAVFITNNDPSITLTPEEIMPTGVVELNDGAATILPPHCGVQSFSGAQPTMGATDFRREMIANAGAAVGMSASASAQDSSGSNFASARYDDVGFGLEQGVVQQLIANRDLTPLFYTWLTEALAVRAVPPSPDWFRLIWRWPTTNRHTDPLKAANANRTRLETAEATYAQIWAENSRSKEQMRAELLDDVTWFSDHGLLHPLKAQVATVSDGQIPDDPGDAN